MKTVSTLQPLPYKHNVASRSLLCYYFHNKGPADLCSLLLLIKHLAVTSTESNHAHSPTPYSKWKTKVPPSLFARTWHCHQQISLFTRKQCFLFTFFPIRGPRTTQSRRLVNVVITWTQTLTSDYEDMWKKVIGHIIKWLRFLLLGKHSPGSLFPQTRCFWWRNCPNVRIELRFCQSNTNGIRIPPPLCTCQGEY